jgi:hypothetical protein
LLLFPLLPPTEIPSKSSKVADSFVVDESGGKGIVEVLILIGVNEAVVVPAEAIGMEFPIGAILVAEFPPDAIAMVAAGDNNFGDCGTEESAFITT